MLKRVLSAGVFLALVSQASASAVAPHRAVYDLQLLRATQGANVGSVSGRMAYEVSGSECDGWTVSFRLVNRFDYKEGTPRLFDTQSSSWETGDGKKMTYSEKEFVDSKQEGEKRLSVVRAGKDSVGEVSITLPKEKKTSISAETVFPMRHQLRLMEAAAKGETRDVSLVYDGSDEEKTVRAISTIGRKVNAGEGKKDKDNPQAAPLQSLPSWPVTIGYYSTEEDNAETPLYQINFDMYENGVSNSLVMDYGSFALSGKLAHLEFLKAETCQ
ncbi:MAG TPA: cell envelope integrity EipB family protein [Aestuariivirga sp.]|nr:cell envelope integrity EipB family protein [Aestuariivirga sp.]